MRVNNTFRKIIDYLYFNYHVLAQKLSQFKGKWPYKNLSP